MKRIFVIYVIFGPLLYVQSGSLGFQEPDVRYTAKFPVSLPAETKNHSASQLLCRPATWESIAVFFIGNYVAHAATVKLPPATPLLANIWICFSALLMPATGLVFGLLAFWHAISGRNESEVQKAAIAGALCVYARSDEWRANGRVIPVDVKISTRTPTPAPGFMASAWLFLKLRSIARRRSIARWIRAVVNILAALIVLDKLGSKDHTAIFELMELVAREDQAEMAAIEEEPPALLSIISATNTPVLVVPPSAKVHGTTYELPGYTQRSGSAIQYTQ
jgi:hypothetical protein